MLAYNSIIYCFNNRPMDLYCVKFLLCTHCQKNQSESAESEYIYKEAGERERSWLVVRKDQKVTSCVNCGPRDGGVSKARRNGTMPSVLSSRRNVTDDAAAPIYLFALSLLRHRSVHNLATIHTRGKMRLYIIYISSQQWWLCCFFFFHAPLSHLH